MWDVGTGYSDILREKYIQYKWPDIGKQKLETKKAQSDILLKFTRKVCKLFWKYWGLIKVFYLITK